MTVQPSDISEKWSIEQIEQALSRLAEEIIARGEKGQVLLPMYSWLEGQLEKREQNRAVMASVRARAEKRAHQ
ncbi:MULTISPECIES: hypothetical protein [Martelella]|uniref:Uncharacterized protein n=1 Tax=Martelella radicis TaxID=1397476 RepID=A0A7W6KQW5_9HYPH|nr:MULTISPECIES: hypothetical protein [Martelella]MBB4124313.1 hypothetical protein [Martelella radicis]